MTIVPHNDCYWHKLRLWYQLWDKENIMINRQHNKSLIPNTYNVDTCTHTRTTHTHTHIRTYICTLTRAITHTTLPVTYSWQLCDGEMEWFVELWLYNVRLLTQSIQRVQSCYQWIIKECSLDKEQPNNYTTRHKANRDGSHAIYPKPRNSFTI